MQVIKNIRLKFGNITLCFIISILCFSNVSALTAEETVDFNFTFNPSLTISLSSDELVIENLMPGNYANSNTISINVETNNRNGYTLTAKVGDSETAALANNSLVNTIASTTFTSIANDANVALASFTPNYWGYTISRTVNDNTLYSGLLYGTTTTLNQTVDPSGKAVGNYYGGTVTNFTIGASAGPDQTSGEYTNIISFDIVPNVSTDATIESLKYLQDLAKLNRDQKTSVLNSMAEGQAYTLTDSRDGTSYAVGKLADGNVWLLDNLALDLSTTRSLTTANTNITSDWTAPTDITTWSDSSTAPKINTESKNTIQSYGSGSGKIGVYYNYCAATAGTYCYAEGSGTGNATSDICPKGWRMPTGGSSSGEYQALYTAYFDGMLANALRTPLSGHFYNDSAYEQGLYGLFWSATMYDSSMMYSLSVDSLLNAIPTGSSYRDYGFSVRCIMDPSVTDYTITYEKNTADAVSNMPTTQADTINSVQKPVLSDSTPARSGYTFSGWCNAQTTVVDGEDSCPGVVYGSGAEYNIGTSSQSEPISITLYAMWKPKLYLQNATASTCPTTATTAYDKRDEQAYTIQKLADNNCWLLDNLALGAVALTEAISSSNTNIPSGVSFTLPASISSGFSSYTAAQINTASYTSTYSYGSGSGKVGVYYNYCAATAGGICTNSNSSNASADRDICPKGWRLPTGGSSGEYQALYRAYSSNATNFKNALRTPLSGYFNSSSASSQGSSGFFWSATRDTANLMYDLYVDSSYVYPQDSSSRLRGYSVRCVLNPPASDISQISTMQDFATSNVSAVKDSMAEGQAYTLTDSRDGTSYAVGKLADGNVWLLDNLALDLSTTRSLTTADTNIASDWTAPTDITTWSNSYTAPKINTESKNATASYGSGSGKIGVYYNYCAATAGTYCYAEDSGTGNDATSDICPEGWRLPTGDSSGEYQALYTAYSSNATNFKNALRTPLSGYFLDSWAYDQDSDGRFWSATRRNDYSMYYLNVSSSRVSPQNSSYRNSGFSVRCVLK